MKLLVINPNISQDVSALIAAEAQRSMAPGTQLVMATAASGMEYIETRFESLLAAPAVAQAMAQTPDADAVVVAAFGDPGLPALKEISGVPVIGITEAALAAAALMGKCFSIIAISDRITAWYRDCVEYNGYLPRLASIHHLRDKLNSIGSVAEDFSEKLVELANQAVHEDGADVIILAGAPLAGLAREVAGRIPVPVIDGIAAGVRFAQSLAAMDTGSHRAGSLTAPPAKPRQGLDPDLDALISSRQHAVAAAGTPIAGAHS
ncbi:Asp/Glu/hydantoin racemase [Glutamicibacter uratoxydans]|uniref:Asp/Glu/hydantoin racemase n=1 Tax=Glutamicibacter uratoxydans TaxID=43667 RepID=A0A4Y4DNP1_GLUUR|nr:aspartate/glutamate racemase family protein [Glutamicibacter uratoxydans]GED06546.1 Asp/Glu/hydantoin racemase [Glutamicibacter uratoxydans]